MVLNITYHPNLSKLKSLLSDIHLLLTPDEEHRKVFDKVPIVGFRRGKSLKDILVRAKLKPIFSQGGGESKQCRKKACTVCSNVKETTNFTSKITGKTYNIRSQNPINCDSSFVVYLLTCKNCGIQYVGSCTTKFRARFCNYRSCQKLHLAKTVPQQELHEHFDLPGHSGFSDFEFTLIDQDKTLKNVRRREVFWQYKLDTFLPKGLNDREVPL